MCWCYALATMIKNSLKITINQAFQSGAINQSKHDSILKSIEDDKYKYRNDNDPKAKNFHKQIRSEIAMIVFPIPMNTNPDQKNFNDFVSINLVVERVS